MHPNAELIQKFYVAFGKKDAVTMGTYYDPAASFSDAVFINLQGEQVTAMWQMLCARASDLRIEYSNVQADELTGSAHWEAWYTFASTGYSVHNKIDANFRFKDGKIIQHEDNFDFWNWAGQALGTKGKLLGWTGMVKKRVRAQAVANLRGYLAANKQTLERK